MLNSYTYKSFFIFKVILVGEANTGKSKLFKSYLNINSPDNPTIGLEFAQKIVQTPDGGKI